MTIWFMLAAAIAAEVTAAVALRYAAGLTRPGPTALVIIGYGIAFWLLSRVVQHLPTSVTYAVWAGAGTALVAVVGTLALGESMSWVKAASLALIIAGVVGLNLSGDGRDATGAATDVPASTVAAPAEVSR
ncbi:DMT family transporter [Micromonospora mirobrigensis]|uniref:Small multidrug resistance pump n=1 Tax=Micromonospora mirobrigensis TaxID=262898 RepID=A0A1C5AKX2_9ACTN|nr:multidrug efflux SMR transporter [Micromonospora mirobrigensis]SCF45882.1 small multidrug resistance pump [Micromonospora mirobrigensis]